MTTFVALPLVATLIVAVVGSRELSRLKPAAAARLNTLLIAAVGIAAIPTLWLIGLSGLAHTGVVNPITDWSAHVLPNHHPFGAIVGITSLALALTGTIRAGRALRRHRRLRTTRAEPLQFIDTDEVYAYTLPGPAKTIVISEGLRRTLNQDELDFVIAHERAHARHRHDRYKLIAILTAAFVPPIASVVTRLEFHLERWADEEALTDIGTDRRHAAHTIAKVALAGASPRPALGIADHGVAARANALLRPIAQPGVTNRAVALTAIAATLALSMYQLHHTIMFATDLAR